MDKEFIRDALAESQQVLSRFAADPSKVDAVQRSTQLMVEALVAGGRIISCGNGGSMCDAMHFAEELSGKFRKVRRPLPAVAISDPAHITCVGNDFGFENIFCNYLESHGRPGDVLLGISTSGKSPNILKAIQLAKTRGMKVVALTGQTSSPVGLAADVDVCATGNQFSDRTQEMHIKIIHMMIEGIERAIFPENYT